MTNVTNKLQLTNIHFLFRVINVNYDKKSVYTLFFSFNEYSSLSILYGNQQLIRLKKSDSGTRYDREEVN